MKLNNTCDTLEQCTLVRAVHEINELNVNDKKYDPSFATIEEEWMDYVQESYVLGNMN